MVAVAGLEPTTPCPPDRCATGLRYTPTPHGHRALSPRAAAVQPLRSDRKHWLWRAVDQHGVVLDILVQSRRNTKAAKRLLRKLLKKHGKAPRVMITDKLASYSAAKRVVMPGVEHRQHKGLNDGGENSHRPTRRRERRMKRFESARHARRFLSAHDGVNTLFHPRRHRPPADRYRAARTQALRIWAEVTGVARVA